MDSVYHLSAALGSGIAVMMYGYVLAWSVKNIITSNEDLSRAPIYHKLWLKKNPLVKVDSPNEREFIVPKGKE